MSAALSIRRTAAVVAKEFRQFARDPVLLVLVLWLYTVEVVICAVSLTFDLNNVPIAVRDGDRSNTSDALVEALERSPSFAVRYRPVRDDEVRRLLDEGRAQLVVEIPSGFGAQVLRADSPAIQLLVDGTNSVTALTALGDARRLLQDHVLRTMGPMAAQQYGPRIQHEIRVWYNPQLTFRHFMVISMIALAAFMVGIIHTAAMTVKEKERGTLEHLLVSPLGTFELVVGKSVPTLVIGLGALVPALVVAQVLGVPFRGGLGVFGLLSAAFLMSAIGIGIVIASITRTLQQALLVAFFVLFPVMFLSGTMTPIESMPRGLQVVSGLSPLRHYMEALLGVMLKGVGLEVLWVHLTWMVGLGVLLFGGATVWLRRQLV